MKMYFGFGGILGPCYFCDGEVSHKNVQHETSRNVANIWMNKSKVVLHK